VTELLWKSFLVPIAVALVTTLLVEYFAKPRLEARKERLLRDRRQIDELVFGFQKIGIVFGALPEPNTLEAMYIDDEVWVEILGRAEQAVSESIDSMSRLSSLYVEKHRMHFRRTSLYLGNLMGLTLGAQRQVGLDLRPLKEAASELEHFDTYFRVYVGLADGQERWIKRWFWKKFTARSYEAEAVETLRKLGLDDPAADLPHSKDH
jgi:hypothetical protein